MLDRRHQENSRFSYQQTVYCQGSNFTNRMAAFTWRSSQEINPSIAVSFRASVQRP
jgi:hypothetical protein